MAFKKELNYPSSANLLTLRKLAGFEYPRDAAKFYDVPLRTWQYWENSKSKHEVSEEILDNLKISIQEIQRASDTFYKILTEKYDFEDEIVLTIYEDDESFKEQAKHHWMRYNREHSKMVENILARLINSGYQNAYTVWGTDPHEKDFEG